MEVASRPYAAGGIALVAASVIAVSPIAPPLPDVHLPNPAQVARSVELAAATTSVDLGQVLQQAVTNAQALLDTIRANPTPILSQIVRNQATTLQSLMTGLQTTGGR